MSATLTIDLPDDMEATLRNAAREDGVSEDTFAVQALADYLRLRRLRGPLPDSGRQKEAFKKTMDDLAATAKRNGMTQDVLDKILNEN